MKGNQDTVNVVTMVRDTVVVLDTVRVALERSTISDLDSVMQRVENREAAIAVQDRIVPVELKTPPKPVVFHYFKDSFWEGYQPPDNMLMFPKRKDELDVYDIYPVPVLANDDIQAVRQAGKNYQLYLSKSDTDYLVPNTHAFPSWTLYFTLFSFLTITLLRMVYTRFFKPVLSAAWSHRETIQLYSNRNSITQNTSLILQFLFVFNGGFFLYLTGSYLEILPGIPGFYLLVILSAGIFLLYQLKFLLFYLVGFFFDQVKASTEYIHSISVFNKILGVLLIPVTAGLTIMNEQFAVYFIYTGVLIIALSYLIQVARGVKIFLDKGFSVFYMFLYLCALEILPLLIVYKLLQT